MTMRVLLAMVLCTATAGRAVAQSIDFDAATIQQLQAAMDAGTLTSERLVQLGLARIEAYDEKGPKLNAVLTLNPKALETARALDAERKAKGKRSPLHGIPVVLKDNFDTADLPTTGGSILLDGSIPPDDAFVVKKLRDAGAVILAKVNLSEFASGGAFSSLGGQTRNPHDPMRTPSGSSGGTGVSVAAGYAPLGLGTDTGGSVRGPSSSNGIVGLKPTLGLLSRDGIIPLALSFDTGGPMARNVADVAVALGVMTGVDPADAATKRSEGRFETRLHQVPERRRAEGRAHRHRPRLHGPGRRGRLGDRGVARRPCARPVPPWSTSASRSGCSTPRASSTPRCAIRSSRCRSAPTWPRSSPGSRARSTEMIERSDRDRGDAGRRRRSEPAALEPVQARSLRAGRSTAIATPRCAISGSRWCGPRSKAC